MENENTTETRITYESSTIKPEKSGAEYEEQAEKWLEQTGSTLHIKRDGHRKYWPDDKAQRDVYEITLTNRGGTSYTFTFGQSIANSQTTKRSYESIREMKDRIKAHRQPDAYSILACLDGCSPGAFTDFCENYGSDPDSRKAETTWKAVVEQYLNIEAMYTQEERNALSEIA